MTSPLVPPATTKLILKYPPLAIKESVVDHAWIVRRTVLVELFSHNSVVVALLLSPLDKSVGGRRTPFHVPHDAVITNPLTLIISVSVDEPVETIFKVPVEVNAIPVAVAHHMLVDHVVVVVPFMVIAALARADHVLPARSLNVNVNVPFHVNNLEVAFIHVNVSLYPVRVARTFAPVFVYFTVAVGAILSIRVTVAVVDHVFP
jgi:hypothetical protein